MKKNKRGFTLVELVIVIAVIAILAAVLLPTFATVIENAKVSAATQKASGAITDYFTRCATVSLVDTVDTVKDLEGYVVIVENGSGNVDYKFVVNEDGALGEPQKGDFDTNNFRYGNTIETSGNYLAGRNVLGNQVTTNVGSVEDDYKLNGCLIFTGSSTKIVA